MTKEHVMVPKVVRDVKAARWEGFRQLAKRLPDHHVLAVELVRTSRDQTAAVFTIVRNHEPFQTVVIGDSRGRVDPKNCHFRPEAHLEPHAAAELRVAADDDIGIVSPDGMALGDPPVKQPPSPGVVAVGSALLSVAFDVAEEGPVEATK
ncbi:MAG TPA: hypothetical protein VFT22_20460 [Kofleriaceae bacterium]|nr:hypothetical protein [Kofleriaceae bacterium]